MIDRAHRDVASQLLRAFLRHEVTGAKVGDQWPRGSDDPAVSEIYFHLVFDCLDSIEEFSETEHAEIVPVTDNCIRFLLGDLEYRHRKYFTFPSILFGCFVPTLIILGPAILAVWIFAVAIPLPDKARPYIALGSCMTWGLLAAAVIVFRPFKFQSRKKSPPDWPFHATQAQESNHDT